LLAERTAVDAAGQVHGRHYTEYVEVVNALKRAGRLDEAEALLLKLVAATKRESDRAKWGLPAPWYTQQLAIIYRKQRRHADEVAILEAYLASVSPRRRSEMAGMAARLAKARALAEAD